MGEKPISARNDLLIVDDLMLLLMDDDGASIQAAGTLYYTLGGAVLTELALLDRIQTDDSGALNGPRVTPAGEGPLPDPLLQSAYDTIAEKTQRVQPLLVLGPCSSAPQRPDSFRHGLIPKSTQHGTGRH